MNIIPSSLAAIRRDYNRIRTRIRQSNPAHQTARRVLPNLHHLTTLRTRLLRCRFITSSAARRVRAQLLRSSFSLWRSLLKRLASIPSLTGAVTRHIRQLFNDIPLLDPHHWAIRLTVFDPQILPQLLPEMQALIPPSVFLTAPDPYWRALKGNLSTAPL